MALAQVFLVAFVISFVGTIPPGTLNLTAIQLGLDQKTPAAWRFALAAAIVEYGYGWIAVAFERLLSNAILEERFQLLAAVVMIVLGAANLYQSRKSSTIKHRFHESGFRRGLILGLINPLAMPFWIAMTAYLKTQSWIILSDQNQLHTYLFGIALGGFSFLVLVAVLAKRVALQFQQNSLLKKIPGVTLLMLGLYGLGDFLW